MINSKSTEIKQKTLFMFYLRSMSVFFKYLSNINMNECNTDKI